MPSARNALMVGRMRARLTPDVANKTGIVLFKPGSDLIPMFRERVLVCTLPRDMSHLPAGLVNSSSQPLLDEISLKPFFADERVIKAAGGWEIYDAWVQKIRACQHQGKHSFHRHDYTTLRTDYGSLCLCYSCDNSCRLNGVPGILESVAAVNLAQWIMSQHASRWG